MKRWLRIFYEPDGAEGGEGDPAPAAAPASVTQPVADPPVDDNPWKGHFTAQLPKDYLNEHKADLLAMKEKGLTIKDVVDEVFSHRKNMERAILLPGKDAKPEDIRAFATKMGVPEKPEDYGLDPKVLGDLDKDGAFAKMVGERYFKKGMTKAQAQEAYAVIAETAKGALAAKAQQDQEAADNFEARVGELAAAGEKDPTKAAERTKESLEYFKRFMVSLGDKELVKILSDRGVLYEPRLAVALANYHKKAFGEAPYIAGDPQGGRAKPSTTEKGFQHGDDFQKEYPKG